MLDACDVTHYYYVICRLNVYNTYYIQNREWKKL